MWDEDGFDAGAHGGEQFLFESSDREDGTAQADFAGHGDISADWAAGELAGEGGEHGHACAGSVLGGGSGGYVDVDIVFSESLTADAEAGAAAAQQAPSGLNRFFHDLAQLSGQLDVAFAWKSQDLDVEQFAPDGSPRQSSDDAEARGVEFLIVEEFGWSQFFFDDGGVDDFAGTVVTGDASGHGAAERGDLSFEFAHTGLAGVVRDDEAERFGGEIALRFF